MTRLVLNRRHGHLKLSKKAMNMLSGIKGTTVSRSDICRYDHDVIRVVQELGIEADTDYCSLHIVDVPDYIDKEWINIRQDIGGEYITISFGDAYMSAVTMYLDDRDKLIEEVTRIKEASDRWDREY